MNLNSHHIRVLGALRGAAALQRKTGPATPDGHEHWFSFAQLREEGRLVTDAHAAAAAEGLRRNGLAARRTLHAVQYWSITGEGVLALLKYEADAGLSGIVRAQLGVEQARYDVQQATLRSTEAERALEAAYREFARSAGALEAGS